MHSHCAQVVSLQFLASIELWMSFTEIDEVYSSSILHSAVIYSLLYWFLNSLWTCVTSLILHFFYNAIVISVKNKPVCSHTKCCLLWSISDNKIKPSPARIWPHYSLNHISNSKGFHFKNTNVHINYQNLKIFNHLYCDSIKQFKRKFLKLMTKALTIKAGTFLFIQV